MARPLSWIEYFYKHSRDPIFGLTLAGTLFEFAYRKPHRAPLFALPPK